jgi:outer membrane protein assembly factor BamB
VRTYEGRVRVRKDEADGWTEIPASRTATAADGRKLSVGSLEPAAKAGTLVREFVLPGEMKQPSSSAHDGLVLWVCDRLNNVLYKLDDRSGSVLGKLDIPRAGKWPNLIGWDGRSPWVQNWDREVYALDPVTGAIRRKIPAVIKVDEWKECAASVDGGGLWIVTLSKDGSRQKLWRVSLETGEVIDTRDYPAKPHLIRFTYLNGAIWTRRTTVIYKIDPETGKVLKQFSGPSIHHGGVDSDGIGSLWNVTGSTRKAYLIDTGERPWKK